MGNKLKKRDIPSPPTKMPTTGKKPDLTTRQKAQLDALNERNRRRPDRPRSKVERTGKCTNITPADDYPHELYGAAVYEALGTRSGAFLENTLDRLAMVTAKDRNITAQHHDAALAILAAVEPENELEATLAAQMVAANECAMRCARLMTASDLIDQFQMNGNLANKFMRTFVAQIEALARMRRGGEQIVKHVHVYEGGQAVVAGTINQGVGGSRKDGEQSDGANAVAGCAALPRPNAPGDVVPIASGEREAAMQDARRD